MRVLVTRPREDAEALALELERRGHHVVLMPLLEIRHLPEVDVPVAGVQAVLLTSANGARALAQASPVRDIAIFAVGDATASAAADRGFADITSAGGDVTQLADLVADTLEPNAGRLLHVGARQLAGDLAGALGARGFDVDRVELYEAVPASRIDDDVSRQLSGGEIDVAMFFSPRSAATFVNLVRHARLEKTCQTLDAVCLSKAVAQELDGIAWHRIAVAARPDQSALLAVLDEGALNPS